MNELNHNITKTVILIFLAIAVFVICCVGGYAIKDRISKQDRIIESRVPKKNSLTQEEVIKHYHALEDSKGYKVSSDIDLEVNLYGVIDSRYYIYHIYHKNNTTIDFNFERRIGEYTFISSGGTEYPSQFSLYIYDIVAEELYVFEDFAPSLDMNAVVSLLPKEIYR